LGAAEIAAHRALLVALSGRHRPIWVPSFTADFEFLSVASATALDVAWGGFARWPLEGNRRDIRIAVRGGAPLYRRLSAATDLGTGVERLVLDEALPVDFSADSVDAISLMALCRQDTDINSLRL